MDITLERILSLMPHKPDGNLVHGAKKVFAAEIGLNHPQIVSDWIAGRNSSYKNYLYQIADKYNVSVEWLKGETDKKEKPIQTDELSGKALELVQLFEKASPELRAAALAVLRAAEEKGD
jgi:hypothetical protein